VKNGEKVKILYGKSKKPIAMIIPFEDMNIPRKIGVLDGVASFKEKGMENLSGGIFRDMMYLLFLQYL
jgi:hypothetical protein